MKATLFTILLFSSFLVSAQKKLKFERVESMPNPAFSFGYTSSNQDIFALGGTQGFMKFTSLLHVYDSRFSKWLTAELKDIPVSLNPSLLYLEDFNGFLLLGGTQPAGTSEVVIEEIRMLDIDDFSLVMLGKLPEPAKKMGLSRQGDKVYFFGGSSNKSRFEPPLYTFTLLNG